MRYGAATRALKYGCLDPCRSPCWTSFFSFYEVHRAALKPALGCRGFARRRSLAVRSMPLLPVNNRITALLLRTVYFLGLFFSLLELAFHCVVMGSRVHVGAIQNVTSAWCRTGLLGQERSILGITGTARKAR